VPFFGGAALPAAARAGLGASLAVSIAPALRPLAPPPPPPPRSPEKSPPVRARPIVPLHTLITADDYPAIARRAWEEGTARVTLSVERQGRVDGCTVTASSGSAVLDSATCRLFTARARFHPARDARGRATADLVRAAITWRLPEDPPPPEPPLP
jgi:protein TonB